jgi:hypothetical protein
MQMFIWSLPPHVRFAISGVVLALGFLVAAEAAADDLRPAKAWLSDFPATPRSWRAVDRTCREIGKTGAAIRSAYDTEMDELDAQSDNPEEMSDDQAMRMLMQGGGVQELQRFAQAQMQMAETVVDDEAPALMKRKEQAEQRLAVLSRELKDEISRCYENSADCGHDGEGMTAGEAACWRQQREKTKQCRRNAADHFLSSAHAPIHEWREDLRIYLERRESDLLEQEKSHKNEYLRAQWKRARIGLLEQAADYADFAARACRTVEGLRLAEE